MLYKKYFKDLRCNLILGTVENGISMISRILVVKPDVHKRNFYFERVEMGQAMPVFIGSTKGILSYRKDSMNAFVMRST